MTEEERLKEKEEVEDRFVLAMALDLVREYLQSRKAATADEKTTK
jgi:hypothetical protein